jgi:hypothetical protein
MRESNFEQAQFEPVKTHEEILDMIEEIKEFERKFEKQDFGETTTIQEWTEFQPKQEFQESSRERWIEVNPEITEEKKHIPIKAETEFEKDKKKKNLLFRIKRRSSSEVRKLKREKKYATFKLRFDQKGDLVNVDLNKPKPKKEKTKSKFKNPFKLKRKRKEETKEESPKNEGKGIGSKLKGVFGNLGKLKNAIPGRGNKTEEESEDTSEEE